MGMISQSKGTEYEIALLFVNWVPSNGTQEAPLPNGCGCAWSIGLDLQIAQAVEKRPGRQ